MTLAMERAEGIRVEFRCPESTVDRLDNAHHGPLFAVLLLAEAREFAAGDLVEIACQRCKQRLGRAGTPVRRVIHRFTLGGDIVATVVDPGL